MAEMVTPKRRSRVTDDPDGLRIEIPAKPFVWLRMFLPFWLCGWLLGEIFVPLTFVRDGLGSESAFLVLWLCGWTVGGGFALLALLYNWTGKEVVSINEQRLLVQVSLLNRIIRAKEYPMGDLRHLRFSPPIADPTKFASSLQAWGLGGGSVAFDYGAATVRFGSAVEESESEMLIAEIKRRFRIAD